jgi:hypothetical protein
VGGKKRKLKCGGKVGFFRRFIANAPFDKALCGQIIATKWYFLPALWIFGWLFPDKRAGGGLFPDTRQNPDTITCGVLTGISGHLFARAIFLLCAHARYFYHVHGGRKNTQSRSGRKNPHEFSFFRPLKIMSARFRANQKIRLWFFSAHTVYTYTIF